MSAVPTPPSPADTAGTIVFTRNRLPALIAGTYTVTVSHRLTNTDPTAQSPDHLAHLDASFDAGRRFAVLGPRFSLDPSAIHSVFPPRDSRGEYTDVLAHVVLSNPTMAWQRSPDGSDGTPWLAVLVVHPDDGVVASAACVGDLQRADFTPDPTSPATRASTLPASAVSYPGLTLEPGESWSDRCRVVDIPETFFSTVAPALGDLTWLAHARTVTGTPNGSDDGSFSVVVANRLPVHDTDCTAYLVSLEDLSQYLPTIADDGTYRPAAVTVESGPMQGRPATSVRLASLLSWRFRPVEPTETFDGYLEHVSSGPLMRPVDAPATDTPGTTVDLAFTLGYTALDHHTRLGDHTVSWVRGPLLPYLADGPPVVPVPDPDSAGDTIETADDAVHYDPTTGMFDVTYAAAWQIGRLLAVQNTSFAQALYDWKRATARATVRAVERELLTAQLADTAPGLVDAGHALDALHSVMGVVASHVAPALTGADPGNSSPTPEPGEASLTGALRPRRAIAARVGQLLADPAALAAVHADNQPPDEVIAWLNRLRMLHGVPFNYLVPDEAMLPAESIRFFQLDPSWIIALAEGALSLGSSTAGDAAHDAAVRPQIRAAAIPASAATGFVLRSGVVADWPGLRVRAVDSDGETLSPIRVERLSPTILLALFAGTTSMLELTEPAVGLHFGVTDAKPLRYITVPPGAPPGTGPGDVIDPSSSGVVPRRVDGLTIAVAHYAGTVRSALDAARGNLDPATGAPGPFTPAEFSVELVEGVQQFRFRTAPEAIDE